jgi:peptide chain release factor
LHEAIFIWKSNRDIEQMKLQISSGQGPAECELAVGKMLTALSEEFPGLEIVEKTVGAQSGGVRSARLLSAADLSFLEGSVLWICKSPYRPHHGRKNWFIDVSVCHEVETVDFDSSEVRFETFRSSGPGGQNVNKVETGVRAIHPPTGISAVSTDERSQSLNRQTALRRVIKAVAALNADSRTTAKSLDRLQHTRLERGNPVRVYAGMEFKRIR